MKKYLSFSLLLHAGFFGILGYVLCPWIESYTPSKHAQSVDVDIFEIREKGGNSKSGSKKEMVQEKVEEKREPENNTVPLEGSEKANRSPVRQEAAESDSNTVLLDTLGDGAETGLTVKDYVRRLREKNTPPVYPRLARIQSIQGNVILDVKVSSDGKYEVQIKESSGSELLDHLTLTTVQGWKFFAFRSTAQEIKFSLAFKFSLEN